MTMRARIFLSRINHIALIFSLLAVLPAQAQSEEVKSQEIQRQMQSLISLLQPSAKQKFSRAARVLEDKVSSSSGKVDFYVASVSAIKAQFGNLPSQDIDALVSLVMFELWKSEEEALKEMLDEMHKMDQAKKSRREYMEYLKKQEASLKEKLGESSEKATIPALAQKRAGVVEISPEMTVTRRLRIKYPKTPILPPLKDVGRLSASELDKEIRNVEDSLNFLEDMTNLWNITLQDQMQRLAQQIQTISNIMKNQHETLKAIIQNLR